MIRLLLAVALRVKTDRGHLCRSGGRETEGEERGKRDVSYRSTHAHDSQVNVFLDSGGGGKRDVERS